MCLVPKIITISNEPDLLKLGHILRNEIFEHKIVLIRGLNPITKNKFENLCFLISEKKKIEEAFVRWDFGHIMELKNDQENMNYLFTNENVPLHWDGAFFEEPSILGFNCISNNLEGGETIFTDTQKIINSITKNDLSILEKISVKYSTKKIAHYGGEIVRPVIDIHPFTSQKIIRLGEEVRTSKNPVIRSFCYETDSENVSDLEKKLNLEEYQHAHCWKEGDILFADNHSLLHGRKEIKGKTGFRHLRRIQIK